MTHHLAQVNIARMHFPLDDPRMADFVALLDPVNAIADDSPGFVWRLQSSYGNATDIPYDPAVSDPFLLVNMSVWQSLESLREFTYRSHHLGVFRDRAKWFAKMKKPSYCLWWIPIGHLPTVAEGRERLEHYWQHGSTRFSFWFSEPFPQPEPVASAQ